MHTAWSITEASFAVIGALFIAAVMLTMWLARRAKRR